jgi:hypothetical protein
MSKNFNNPIKYRKYIKNPLEMDEIERIYLANDINPNRADIYADYVQSLCDLIFLTYLGDEHHKEPIDRLEHFKWCWEKNQWTYELMGYKFAKRREQFEYFETFFVDVFYFVADKNMVLEESIKNVWGFVFDYNVIKSRLDIDNFIEIYNMFEETEWFKK